MKRNLFFFLTFIFFLFAVPSFSQVVDEIENDDNNGEVMSLFEIEKLIRQTDYTQALKELNIYIEKKPDYFDNAQRLIKIIMNRRQQYSVLAEKAIKTSTENPEDHEATAKIILQMRSIEKNPPAEIKAMIDMLEEMHLFKYYAYLFETIEEESASLTEKQNYFDAIAKVQNEGFDIYKEEFYDEWQESHPEIIESVEKTISDLNNSIIAFEDSELHKEYDSITQMFVEAVNNDDYILANSYVPQIQSIYSRYSEIRNEIYETGVKMNELFELQKEYNSEITDASYLPFMSRFILGVNTRENSGILGAVDYKFTVNVEKMKLAIENTVVSHKENYIAVLPDDVFQQNINFSSIQQKSLYVLPFQNYSNLGKTINSLYSLLQSQNEKASEKYQSYVYSLDYEKNLSESTYNLMEIVQKLIAEQKNQNQIIKVCEDNAGVENFDSSKYVDDLMDSVFKMSEIVGAKNDLLPENSQWGRDYLISYQNYISGTGDYAINFENHTQKYTDFVNQIFDVSTQTITASWKIISDIFINNSDEYLATAEKYSTSAQSFTIGFENRISAEDYKSISGQPDKIYAYSQNHNSSYSSDYHYPDLSKQMTDYIYSLCEKYISTLSQNQETLKTNLDAHVDWKQNAELVDIVSNAVDYLENKKNQILNYMNKADQSSKESQTKINNALYVKNNADSLFEESLEAYKQEKLSQAETLLLEASEKYNESLAILDDNDLRTQADEKKFELSEKIMNARNEIVVRESRELYTQARDAQNHDRYDDAETLIIAAINKWAETHSDKNSEFEDFRQLVNTAVSMKTGRDLLPSDPLYSEMSQFLSFAYQYYDEGEKLYKLNDKVGGNEALDKAVENLNKLKVVYPLNQEASLLILKIDRLRDSKKFNEEFEQKINDALVKARNRDTQTEGYNTLMTYYNLEPNYKGLKDKIYNLEIELGMRQKPVDNTAITRANKLTADAQKIFNSAGNDTDKLNQALSTVNQALALNPNNKTAENLKDKISTKIGSSKVIVISSDDLNLLTQAKKAYQNGNVDEANTYMLRLLNNNPNNINVKEVSDLYNKIKSQL